MVCYGIFWSGQLDTTFFARCLPISLTVAFQQQPLTTLAPKMAVLERLGCSLLYSMQWNF